MSASPATSAPPEPATVNFFDFHQPGLEDGDYEISLKQTLGSRDPKAPLAAVFEATARFSVCGERFELPPALIDAMFPPPGSLGEHSHVFPHVSLSRSTLPWERQVDDDEDLEKPRPPWLALLLFDEEEKVSPIKPGDFSAWQKVTPQVVALQELIARSDDRVKWPGIKVIEKGQDGQDRVTVIEVKKSFLKASMPSRAELQLLAHVRHAVNAAADADGDEFAVVIGNRLPRSQAQSIAHLVSLEGRFALDGEFAYQDAADDDCIRLVSLKSWSFSCVDDSHSFRGLLNNLNRATSTLQLPRPGKASEEAAQSLALGFVPLPHTRRGGDATFSWYHSPLSPAENQHEMRLPARTADELVRYLPAHGMFDVSYAAAWELGRLLALQSKAFSVSLYQWKRRHATQLKRAEQRLAHSHLPNWKLDADLELPEVVADWFEELSLLKGVPFAYLVPDERMLPPESIRFFWVDDMWVDCLLDGAFSIGRVTTADHLGDLRQSDTAANPHDVLTGCIIRSEVVAGWPSLLVDAYDAVQGGTQLDQLRMERLSTNVLLCLFTGQARRVEIHQKPEAMHFGFTTKDDHHAGLWKPLRTVPAQTPPPEITDFVRTDGPSRVPPTHPQPPELPWRDESRRVVDIKALATAICAKIPGSNANSASFAYQMIEGVEKVVFQVGGPTL